METIQTSHGIQSIEQVLDRLAYASYAAQRGYGVEHERLAKFGLGNDDYKRKYESSLPHSYCWKCAEETPTIQQHPTKDICAKCGAYSV